VKAPCSFIERGECTDEYLYTRKVNVTYSHTRTVYLT